MDQITEPRPDCIAAAIQILGDKWSGLLIRELTVGPRRFSVLQQALSGISPRTLSQRLDSLEEQGILVRTTTTYPEYSLTPKGEDLGPILCSMIAWGAKHGK